MCLLTWFNHRSQKYTGKDVVFVDFVVVIVACLLASREIRERERESSTSQETFIFQIKTNKQTKKRDHTDNNDFFYLILKK